MAKTQETTFKDMLMDERYKKLERTLKMVLLKNADTRNGDNGHAGTWPSVSSINGDHFDTSCAGMSVQSSRMGSEVLASSANFRNIHSQKQQYIDPRSNMVTSSEVQFPISKDSMVDRVMMPPPRTPGITFGRSKRFSAANQRLPLTNMQMNMDGINNGFVNSTPATSISSIPKCSGSMSINSSAVFQDDEDYRRNVYEGNTKNGSQRQERHFSRWRIMLNDKAQLIIKGTLECGRVARSKPVIRRLTSTSVQSIYMHIYHLQGNLVDERGELPDYVSGKFFNGFPDDWENVYQVWQNYISDGSRLSFRWPTAVTDSDDDIKSGITEISYHPEFDKRKKAISPRKRARSSKASSSTLTVMEENDENRSNTSRCSCSHNASSSVPLDSSTKTPEALSRVESKCNQNESREGSAIDGDKKSYETTQVLNSTAATNTLKELISEDKINVIIENLTSKNCSIEYINNIVQMLECFKFVVSYQSNGENDSDKNNSIVNEKENSRSPKKKNRSTEENYNSITPNSNIPRDLSAKIDNVENTSTAFNNSGSKIVEQSYKDKYTRPPCKRLTQHDYDSSESENDYYDDKERTSTRRRSRSQQMKLRSHKMDKNYQNSVVSRTSGRYVEPASTFDESHRAMKYVGSSASRSNRHDSSLSEDEPLVERRFEQKATYDRGFSSPRKRRIPEQGSRRRNDHYDSSISITEDEERFVDKSMRGRQGMRKKQYDSSVSITEEEHENIRGDRGRLQTLNYFPQSNSRPVAPEIRRNGDNLESQHNLESLHHFSEANSEIRRNDDNFEAQQLQSYQNYPELNSRSVESDSRRNDVLVDRNNLKVFKHPDSPFRPIDPIMGIPKPGTPRKKPTLSKPAVAANDEADSIAPNPVNNVPAINNFVSEKTKDSAYWSSELKRAKKSESNREIVELESNKSVSRSNEQVFERVSENPEITVPKSKSLQSRKKPVVVSSEITNVDLKSRNWVNSSRGDENDKNAANASRALPASNNAKNPPIRQKTSAEKLPELAKVAEPKVSPSNIVPKDARLSTKEKAEKSCNKPEETLTAKFGSQENPKQLMAWVPAVICDDEGDSKYHLVFEGKLINEAGHVANRKFTTNFVRKRVTAKLIETIDQEFYQLVGDLKDTKHVVPKELVKLCHSGCPGRISQFCEKWITFTADNNKTPPRDRPHNRSVDCLSVPTSSRGRRILPPLNFWAGERIITKDNKAIYSPGNSQETSIPSSLEKTNDEIVDKKSPTKTKRSANLTDQSGKRTDETKTTEAKKKDLEKISPSKKTSPRSGKSRDSQRIKGGKRRLINNVPSSSSESEEDEKTKPTPRKRKARTNDRAANTETSSTMQLRNSSKNNTASPQSPENTKPNSGRGSLEKLLELEVKSKLRKRQKIDHGQEPSPIPTATKQSLTLRNAVVTCTHYKNVPLRDDDLSEDQLSTM